MGKWAQYAKRGTARQTGFISAPLLADFTIGVPTATTIPTTRVAAIPAGANAMIWIAIHNTTNAVASQAASLVGLTTATQYRVGASWWNGNIRVSDWSPFTLVTTA